MKNTILKITAVFFGFALMVAGLFVLSKQESFQLFGEVVNRVDTEEKLIALTFDDGPSKLGTERVLKILKEENVKATFYLVGEAISRNMEHTKKIVKDGHEIGNHSASHDRMVLKSYDFVKNEIEETNKLIREAGYEGEITFRPPYGKKLFMLPFYLQQNDITSVTWDVEPDSRFSLHTRPEVFVEEAVKNTKPGSIILMHVMFQVRKNSMAAVPGMIRELKSRGYRFVTVSELIESGKQPVSRKHRITKA